MELQEMMFRGEATRCREHSGALQCPTMPKFCHTLMYNSDQTRSSASCNLQLLGFGFCGFKWADMQPNHPVRKTHNLNWIVFNSL